MTSPFMPNPSITQPGPAPHEKEQRLLAAPTGVRVGLTVTALVVGAALIAWIGLGALISGATFFGDQPSAAQTAYSDYVFSLTVIPFAVTVQVIVLLWAKNRWRVLIPWPIAWALMLPVGPWACPSFPSNSALSNPWTEGGVAPFVIGPVLISVGVAFCAVYLGQHRSTDRASTP